MATPDDAARDCTNDRLGRWPHNRHRPVRKPGHFGKFVRNYRLDGELEARSKDRNGSVNTTRVIVELKPGHQLPNEFKNYLRRFAVGGSLDGTDHNLDLINGSAPRRAERPAEAVVQQGRRSSRVHYDRPIKAHNYRTSVTVGARTVQDLLGYTGAGVGVAVIDSGITTWHDDLTNKTSKRLPVRQSARPEVRRLRQRPHAALRRQRPRHARRRHHRGQRLRLVRREDAASRPTPTSSR